MKNRFVFLLLLTSLLLLFSCSPAGNDKKTYGENKIAFVSDRDGNQGIYVMDYDGSNVTKLTSDLAFNCFPVWSPDASKIAFTSDRDGNTEIYVIDTDGSNLVNLSNNPARDGIGKPDSFWLFFPELISWSPDGSKIAFVSDRDGNTEIYVINTDGSNPTNLTNNPSNDYFPVWSPDGSKIVYASELDGDMEIYTMDDDGSNPTNLTNNLDSDLFPVWSPDGSKIVFVSSKGEDLGEMVGWEIYSDALFLMNADGTDMLRLILRNDENVIWYAWLP